MLEETGFDASKLVSEQNALSINCNDRVVKLYVFSGWRKSLLILFRCFFSYLVFDVPREYAFEAQCRGEVQSYQWFDLQCVVYDV